MKIQGLTVLIAILASWTSYAGGISSTGGEDHPPSDGAAWFIGERSVRYCIEVSPSFGVSASDAAQQIAKAFAQWQAYLQKKNLNGDGTFGSSADTEARFDLGKIFMNTSAMGVCDGSEDLKFYLGVTGEEVRAAMKSFADPVAFAQKTSFDRHTAWGKGFIWVQSPGVGRVAQNVWAKPYFLYGVLLHEIGHVLGNSHIGNTVMDENLPLMAAEGGWKDGRDQGYFTRIDDRRELYLCEECAYRYRGNAEMPDEQAFEFLTGRKPAGKVKSRITSDGMMKARHPRIVLELADDQGSTSFELGYRPFMPHLSMSFGDTPVFKKSKNGFAWSRHSDSVSYLMTITAKKTGEKVNIVMERNMGVSPMVLQFLDPPLGWQSYFFAAETY